MTISQSEVSEPPAREALIHRDDEADPVREAGFAGGSLATTTPPEIAAALSLLNSHARAYGCGRDFIYEAKSFAALLNAVAGKIEARPVAMMAKCHYCSGTGKFISHYDGPTNDPCYRCSHTGYVHLRFVETVIEGQHWHHPWERQGSEIYRASLGWPAVEYLHVTRELSIKREGYEPERVRFASLGEWKPNSPGEKLYGELAATLLNLVEDWLFSIRDVPSVLRWRLESAQQRSREYNLDLGRRLGDGCHYCGRSDVAIGQAHVVKPFEWSVGCCSYHSDLPVDQWDKAVPKAALTPQVLRWRERRMARASE